MPLLTLPGKIIANLLYDHLGFFWLMILAVIIGLLVFSSLHKKKECIHIALIFSSILLAFTPSVFRFASYDSKLFWLFIFSSVAMGFVYYYVDKDSSLNMSSTTTQIDQNSPSLNQTTEEFVSYQNNYFLLLLLVFALAFYLRTFQIEKYPAGYSYWETNAAMDLIKYEEGTLNLNSYLSLFKLKQINYSNESPIFMGLAFPFYKIFGISLVSARYFSVLWGMAGLIFLFLYLRQHFSMESAVFLCSFTALELINIIFSRTGFHFITSFTYSVFVLYLLEITFAKKKLYFSIPLAFLLGLAVFGLNYVYLPAKAVMLVVIVILSYKIFFRRGFFIQNVIPLTIFSLTFSLAVYFYTQGSLKTLWPSYGDYLTSLNKNSSAVQFIKNIIDTGISNIKITFNRIVFIERAPDSLSKFKEGGLISGPTLCLIPLAAGFALAGIRREKYFSIIICLILTLLPAMLGVPNARRLLLFLSMLLILPGITVYLLFDNIRRLLEWRKPVLLISTVLLFSLFSYNLYIFIDINNNMNKTQYAAIPFAESGWRDITYSRATTALAKEIKEFIKHDDVYFYYSNPYDEDGSNPTGTYEQFLVESYSIKKGGKLFWMNPFTRYDNLYFHKFETVVKMILESDRDIKVIFIKPLGDEMSIYEKLKTFFPHLIAEERIGDTSEDKLFVLTISHKEKDNIISQKLVSSRLNNETISRLLEENMNTDFSFDGYFMLENDSNILFKNNITGFFDITIDNYKLNKDSQALSLLKGIHEVKMKFVRNQPFAAMKLYPGKFEDFSALLLTMSAAKKLSQSYSSEFSPYVWSLEKSIPSINMDIPHAFYYNQENQYLYSNYGSLFNASGQIVIPNNGQRINKILQNDTKTFLIQSYGWGLDPGFLAVYDSKYLKIREIPLDGYPFDLFFGNIGELYITYLNREKITIIQSNNEKTTWDTSSFSKYPVWNGAVDKNGDIILLTAEGKIFIFDKQKNLYNSFNVDISWRVFPYLIRHGGGIVLDNGIIHILDSLENSIKSYNKNGRRLYYTGDSLFRIPPNFKIDFIQKLNDKIVVVGRRMTGEILIFKREEIKAQGGTSLPLLEFTPSEVSVGWDKYSVNSGSGLLQTVNNEKYNNFIWAHAPSHLAYHLKEMFESLSVGYGLDDRDGHDAGSVKFIIKGDGKLLFESKVIRAFDPIEKVRVDTRGVDKLELIVDPTEDGYAFDQSIWINPVLHVGQSNNVNAGLYSNQESGSRGKP